MIIGALQQWQSRDRDSMGVGVSGTTGYDDMYEVLRTVSKMGGLRETGECRVKSSPASQPQAPAGSAVGQRRDGDSTSSRSLETGDGGAQTRQQREVRE